MYNYSDIKSVHFEITSNCQATCPMCPRRPGGGPLNPNVVIKEVSIEQFKSWFDEQFVKQLRQFYMCGNLGDPIIAKDVLDIFEYLRSVNPEIQLRMHTNGSARTIEWWKKLAEYKVSVVFAIDGLEDTHELYRIGTNWNKIIENAKAFMSAGGDARWDMLVFKHNEHQVDACRQLSVELGFRDFYIKHTSRFRNGKFNVIDEQGRTVNILYPTSKSTTMIDRVEKAKQEALPNIHCKAMANREIYVSATGNVSPCCWLDLEWYDPIADHRIDYMDKVGRFPNLNRTSLKEIFLSNYFETISNCWGTHGLKECSKQCGSFDKFNEQYVNE